MLYDTEVTVITTVISKRNEGLDKAWRRLRN